MMKKIYLLTLTGLMLVGVNAQRLMIGTNPMTKTVPAGAYERFNGQAYLDLDAYDASLHTIAHYAGISDGTYSYQCNNNDTLTGSFAVVYERFDTLITTTDYVNYDYTPNDGVISVMVDSLFLWCQHDNTSGMNDTLEIKMVGLDGSRRPNDADVIYSNTMTTNTAWGAVVHSWAPAILRTGSNWGFAMRAEYRDPSVLDTMNFIFGAADLCEPSEVYPACFYRVNLGPGTAPTDNSILIPLVSDAGYWYNDCNGNNTADWPEENSFTHWGMWAVVTIVENVGISEQEAKDISFVVYPNPSSDVTNIRFDLENSANNVTMTVTDLTGKVIENRILGARPSGATTQQIDVSTYSTGIYMVSLDIDGTKITRRIVRK
jgi:hypothetical protein